MHPFDEPDHRKLCTIELVAHGRAERCPAEACGLWMDGCVLDRVEAELERRPEVASLLVDLRRELESARRRSSPEVLLSAVPAGPAGPSTELV